MKDRQSHGSRRFVGFLFFVVGVSLFTPRAGMGGQNPRPIAAGDLLGAWSFCAYIYEGVRRPPRNPRLQISYIFHEQGRSHLYWLDRDGTRYCSRIGEYLESDGWLIDRVVEVDSENTPDCARDPDMQPGRVSRALAWRVGIEFWLEVGLSGEPLTYVFCPVEH